MRQWAQIGQIGLIDPNDRSGRLSPSARWARRVKAQGGAGRGRQRVGAGFTVRATAGGAGAPVVAIGWPLIPRFRYHGSQSSDQP